MRYLTPPEQVTVRALQAIHAATHPAAGNEPRGQRDDGEAKRLSSRCILSGVRSPAYSATDQPFREGRSLARALTYLPACSHVCVRAKHDRSSSIRADLSRSARRAPILASAAALYSFVITSNMIPGRLHSHHGNLPHLTSQQLRTQLAAAVLGLSNMNDAVSTVFHEIYHINSFASFGTPGDEGAAEMFGQQMLARFQAASGW